MTTLRERWLVAKPRSSSLRPPTPPSLPGLLANYRVAFGSCYVYSPKGRSEVSGQSRLLCARVKRGSPRWLKYCAARVRKQVLQEQCFRGFFAPDTVLVPIPKSGLSAPRPLWTARQLASALQRMGLGGSTWTGLTRATVVEKSSGAWMWHRPTVQDHYQSFAIEPPSTIPAQIVLVDDVVTKGRTLIAAAIRLHEVFPHAQIRAFALLRTMGFVSEIDRLVDPCRGEIRWNGEDAYREP